VGLKLIIMDYQISRSVLTQTIVASDLEHDSVRDLIAVSLSKDMNFEKTQPFDRDRQRNNACKIEIFSSRVIDPPLVTASNWNVRSHSRLTRGVRSSFIYVLNIYLLQNKPVS